MFLDFPFLRHHASCHVALSSLGENRGGEFRQMKPLIAVRVELMDQAIAQTRRRAWATPDRWLLPSGITIATL